MITKLTPQQKESIAFYQEKWRAASLSTERIDRKQVLALLEDVHCFYPESFTMPEVIFYESPYAAFSAELIIATGNFKGLSDDETINEVASLQTLCGDGLVRMNLWFDLYMELPGSDINPQISPKVWELLKTNLLDEIGITINEQLWDVLWDWLSEKLRFELETYPEAYRCFYNNFISSDSEWASYAGLFDFCINELSCKHEQEQWRIYEAMCAGCGWWFLPMPTHYIICERPIKLLLDDCGKLHADGESAIEFADGFALYARHGEIYSTCFP